MMTVLKNVLKIVLKIVMKIVPDRISVLARGPNLSAPVGVVRKKLCISRALVELVRSPSVGRSRRFFGTGMVLNCGRRGSGSATQRDNDTTLL